MRGFTVVCHQNLRQIWQRIARFRHWGDENWRNMLLIVLYIILICTYHCERIHSGISWNLRQIWQRIARFRRWGDESWKSMLLIVLYNTDLYIPLWEDSQWYIIKPASDLAEDCQIWRWRDGSGEIILLIVHIYITNVCIPLWEDSQWYIMKTYFRPGRGLPGLTLGRNYIMDRAYIYV